MNAVAWKYQFVHRYAVQSNVSQSLKGHVLLERKVLKTIDS